MQLSAAQHTICLCCCLRLAAFPRIGCCRFPNKQHALYSTTHTCLLSICRHAARNLHHPYLPGKLAGNIQTAAEVPCGQDTRLTRTIDGTCNYPGMSRALNPDTWLCLPTLTGQQQAGGRFSKILFQIAVVQVLTREASASIPLQLQP